MTKTELIIALAHRFPYLTKQDADSLVGTIFGSMMDSLVQGDRVEIRGFGSSSARERAAREGRNPRSGETVLIPANRYPHFKVGKVGKDLYDRLNWTEGCIAYFSGRGSEEERLRWV